MSYVNPVLVPSGSTADATLESTTAHTAYNGLIIAFVAIGLVLYASGV